MAPSDRALDRQSLRPEERARDAAAGGLWWPESGCAPPWASSAPVSVIASDTGKILNTIVGTEGTEEIIHENGVLYLVADTNKNKEEFENGPRMNFPKSQWIIRKKQVLCCDLDEGKVLWSKSSTGSRH